MRTTIEIRDEHRAKLLEIAARRGEKGFSNVVSEAIERYLESMTELDRARVLALGVRGALSDRDAEEIRKKTEELRTDWR